MIFVFVSPPPPDFGALPNELVRDLEARFHRVPFDRVHRRADYYALRSVEEDHVRRLAGRFHLSDVERQSVEFWWLAQVDYRLVDTRERWSSQSKFPHIPPRGRRRHKFLFQLWLNTFGPGGRTWFSNRFVSVRHYTIRVRWRP
jgi:hypothetical protein